MLNHPPWFHCLGFFTFDIIFILHYCVLSPSGLSVRLLSFAWHSFCFFGLTDLQGAPNVNRPQNAKAAVQVAEENHSWSPADQKSIGCPAAMSHSRARPASPLARDVFQLAPFKAAAKETKVSALAHKPADAGDVFLRAPFGMKLQNIHAVSYKAPGRPLLPGSSATGFQAPYVHVETPVLQQPVAVHRVVSRIGQQAAVGSVAVGPLHAWTITGRSLDDPFTAAPFQPRCSQGKP